jgi:hypothetical protein
MLPDFDPTHPFFAVPHDRSRSYLAWARRLAQAEAFFVLFGTCSAVDAAAGGSRINPYVIVGLVLAISLLTLGNFVGRGSVRAAVILLGLSISREMILFVPGMSHFLRGFAPLLLLDLILYTQAVRAAVALTLSATGSLVARPVVAKPVVAEPVVAEPVVKDSVVARPVVAKPVAAKPLVAWPVVGSPVVAAVKPPIAVGGAGIPPGFKWPVEWSESPPAGDVWAREKKLWAARGKILEPNFTLDFIAASFLVAVAMAWLNLIAAALPDNSGWAGFGILIDFAYALGNLTVAAVLFAAAYGGKKGKSWTGAARFAGYFLLVECLSTLKLLWILASAS